MTGVEQPGERHPAPEPLRLVQDLVNTTDLESGADDLDSPAALTRWAAERGVGAGEFDAAALDAAVELREALREVCAAHAGPQDVPADARQALDALLGAAPLRLRIDAEGGASVNRGDDLTGLPALTAAVAAAIATAVADGTWPRLKACAADTCRWAYYDRSPAGRSRWCSMAVCGSRAKMRSYRRRKAG